MVTLKETPESVKRSCVYCRKLLEAKKYEDSITWYRDFIEKYRTKYIVDDAQFQLASIYDRHLYDYSKALAEYDRLLEQFPDSTKAEQVRQRIEYITGYNDYDFIPLASFEKTKSETYKTDKTEAIQTVENLVEKYPDAKIRNKMLFWLGHVLSQDNPDQSIYYHRELISASSGDEKKEALISMGDVYYTYKQYPDAICAYTDALGVGDSKYNFGVEDKINKSIRNITRERVLKAILVLLGLLFIGAVLIKPLFFTKAEVLRTGILLLVLLLFAYSVWRIFYRNYPEVAAFIPALFLTLSASHLISAVYSRKVFSKYPAAVNLICTSLGFVLLNIMLYYVFLYYHHFLPSVGL
jgi:tetratricopeptide (TPR) repeat protein